MRVFYSEASYGNKEIEAVLKVLKENRLSLMCGSNVSALEDRVSMLFQKKFGLMTNSGSSANLLAIKSLNLPENSKVITPSLTFSTTVSPIVQSNLIPLFVDVDINTLQIDTNILEDLNSENISAILVPNLIGNIANWEKIYNFAKRRDIKVIEDSADTIGYSYETSLNQWSDITTTSFYASHVVTGCGFGGMVCFNDESNYNLAKSLRGWGRRSSQYGETEDYERRFSAKISDIDYDDKYVFDDLGFNFLPSEVSAAFANVQLDNLEQNIQKRLNNFMHLKEFFQNNKNIQTFNMYDNVKTGWLAFPIMLVNKLDGKRKEFQIFLEKRGIQTRTIFTGNILKQPVAQKFAWESFGNFDISDLIMKNGILLGCHNEMTDHKLKYMTDTISLACKELA